MNLKQELQNLNNRLDKCRNKLAAAKSRNDQPVVNQSKMKLLSLKNNVTASRTSSHVKQTTKVTTLNQCHLTAL
ncbi:hypothetical protein AB733_02395 [Photobacterium swingsii]|nr:hypothetical protein AB733_02395 [Photobacterium swingsii]